MPYALTNEESVAPAGQSGAGSNYQEIADVINLVKQMSVPGDEERKRLMQEDAAAKRKRMIGTLLAGALGGLANRKTREGGLSGATAAAAGFNQGRLSQEQERKAALSK